MNFFRGDFQWQTYNNCWYSSVTPIFCRKLFFGIEKHETETIHLAAVSCSRPNYQGVRVSWEKETPFVGQEVNAFYYRFQRPELDTRSYFC